MHTSLGAVVRYITYKFSQFLLRLISHVSLTSTHSLSLCTIILNMHNNRQRRILENRRTFTILETTAFHCNYSNSIARVQQNNYHSVRCTTANYYYSIASTTMLQFHQKRTSRTNKYCFFGITCYHLQAALHFLVLKLQDSLYNITRR